MCRFYSYSYIFISMKSDKISVTDDLCSFSFIRTFRSALQTFGLRLTFCYLEPLTFKLLVKKNLFCGGLGYLRVPQRVPEHKIVLT